MKFITIIIAVVAIIASIVLQVRLTTALERLDTHETALKEMAGVMIHAGIVIQGQDGKPVVNTLLREAVENNRPQ